MGIGLKLGLGFLVVAALVAVVGFIGIQSLHRAQNTTELAADVDKLLLRVTEKGSVVSSAVSANDLHSFEPLKLRDAELDLEILAMIRTLQQDDALYKQPDFLAFLDNQRDLDFLHSQLLENHEELLTRRDLFSETPLLEKSLRSQVEPEVFEVGDPHMTADFWSVRYSGKEALFQYQDREHFEAWFAAINHFIEDIEANQSSFATDEKRILLNQLSVYLDTAKILGQLSLREREIKSYEARLLNLMRGHEAQLTALRDNISDQLVNDVSNSTEQNWNFLVLTTLGTIIGALAVGLVISRSVSNPLAKLSNAAVQLGQGDLTTRVDISAKDETGALARSFNQMAENLQTTTVSKDYVDNIMTSMSDSLLVVSPEFTIQTANQAACNLLGYTVEELIGAPIKTVMLEADSTHLESALTNFTQANAEERTYQTKGGESVSVLFSASIMCDAEDQPLGMVCVAQDITDRKRAEKILNQQYEENAQLLEAEQLRGQGRDALFQLASHLAQPISYQEKVNRVFENLLQIAQSDSLTYRVPDASGQGLQLVFNSGDRSIDNLRATLLSYDYSIAGAAFREAQPVIINDYPSNPLATPSSIARGLKSLMILPIKSQEVIIGTVGVGCGKPGHFTASRAALLTAIGEEFGVLLENARLSEELQTNAQEMAVIDEVARIMTSTLNLDDVYEQFAREMKKLVDFDRININIIDYETESFYKRYLIGRETSGRESGNFKYPMGGQTEHLVKTGQSLIRQNLEQESRFQLDPGHVAAGLLSCIAVPLISKGRVNGTLVLRSSQVGAYGLREQVILERVARQISPAIENATLYEELQGNSEEMDLVDEVARIITSTLNIDDVYSQFAQEMKKLVNFDRAIINIVDPVSSTYTPKFLHGDFRPGLGIGVVTPLAGSLSEWCVENRQALVRGDMSVDSRFISDDYSTDTGLRSSIMVPLISKDVVIGTLGLRSRQVDAYGQREQAVLERLARQIAPAVEIAGLYENLHASTEEMALVDEVARIITSTLKIEEVYDLFAQEVKKLVDYYGFYINIIDREVGTYTLKYLYGPAHTTRKLGAPMPLNGSQTEWVMQSGQTLLLQDSDLNTQFASDPDLADRGLHSTLMVPLITKGVVIGSMGMRCHLVGAYGPRERAILERLAKQIAPAIENAELFVDLVSAREDALAASKTKSAFLAGMSHEIRTPMNAIIGMADLLSETPLTGEQTEYIDIFRNAGENLLEIINDILDISKVEAGQLYLEETEFDLAELVENTAQILAIRAHQKNIEFNCGISPDVTTNLVGDPVRLRQIITNLLGNAVKFTEKGEVSLQVRKCSGLSDQGDLLFAVSDTGIGIPPDRQGSVFDSFSQADSSTTRKYGGTGLGLAICHRLVKMMGGNIWLESEVGRGSTFYFTVRMKVSAQPNNATADLEGNLNGLKVLIVDDNSTNRLILSETLRAWGTDVTAVESGELGLSEMTHARDTGNPYQLLLVDLRMPGKSGFDVIEQMERDTDSVPTTILLLTSENRAEDIAVCQELNISRYLIKPVRRNDLYNAITGSLKLSPLPRLETTLSSDQANGSADHQPNILLVDDSPDNRLLIKAYLKKTPVRLEVAENGEIAVQKFTTGRYDLVLMDMQMPVTDGYTATRVIRNWEMQNGKSSTPIIALTANALKEDAQRSLDAGCTSHLTKPIKKEVLIQAMEDFIGEVAQ